jgi:hypothetical protein
MGEIPDRLACGSVRSDLLLAGLPAVAIAQAVMRRPSAFLLPVKRGRAKLSYSRLNLRLPHGLLVALLKLTIEAQVLINRQCFPLGVDRDHFQLGVGHAGVPG